MGVRVDQISGDVTDLLARWRDGDRQALRDLMPLVYAELRRLADRSMQAERRDHTLQATALVHEAYMRLMDAQPPSVHDRGHFYALAARLMRRILVDHARKVKAARRGGGALKVQLDKVDFGFPPQSTDLLALDEALDALSAIDARKAKVIELRFFGGLEVKETAQLLGVSVPTVVVDTRIARAWLAERMRTGTEA